MKDVTISVPESMREWVRKWTTLRDGIENCVWPPPDWDPILSEIGRIVFNWNRIEEITTKILNTLIGGQERSTIITAHMNTAIKNDALRTIAYEFLSDEERDHILHAIMLFNRLRERRNYYIHAFNTISFTVSGSFNPQAQLDNYSAKGRLRRHVLTVTVDHLHNESVILNSATHYFGLLYGYFAHIEGSNQEGLPDKFPIPDRLTKPSRFILNETNNK